MTNQKYYVELIEHIIIIYKYGKIDYNVRKFRNVIVLC